MASSRAEERETWPRPAAAAAEGTDMRTTILGPVLLALAIHATAADWEPVATELLKTEKTGFGGLCGVVVDHGTGDVYVNLSDRGLFRSTDQGKTGTGRKATQPFKGRTERPGCLMLDPSARASSCSSPSSTARRPASTTPGRSMRIFDKKSSHVDWCAVDWTDPELKFVLALKHEAGGLLLVSRDGGKTFDGGRQGLRPGVGLRRQDRRRRRGEDEGQAEARPAAHHRRRQDVPAVRRLQHRGAAAVARRHAVLAGGRALIATTDQGETWKKIGDLKDGRYGPIFGKDAKHMFVLTPAGVVERTDGGATWSKPLPLPKEMKGWSPLTWLEYDPSNDVLYVMKMGRELCTGWPAGREAAQEAVR